MYNIYIYANFCFNIYIYMYIPIDHIYIYICERDLLGPFHVYHLYEEFNSFTY